MSTPLDSAIQKSATLIEALPYLLQYRGKTFLIKMGGSAMEDPQLVKNVMRDIVFMELAGINPVVVHGGGKAISAAMNESGIEPEWVEGFRRTTTELIKIVEQVLSYELNPSLVSMINDNGGHAKGIPGHEVLRAKPYLPKTATGEFIDIGRVGQVEEVNLAPINELISQETVPVISPIALNCDDSGPMNVNADLAAAAIAKELKASKLIYLSDVPGVLKDKEDPTTLISSIDQSAAASLIEDGTIAGGMLPKVNSALEALQAGVDKVHFIDGRMPHSLLLEIFTPSGIGTEICQ